MTKASVWLDLNFSPHIRDYNKTEGQELISTVEGQPVPCPWHTCSVRTAKWYSSRTTHPYTSWPALVIPVIVTETTPEWEIQVVSRVTHNGVVQPTLFFSFLPFPTHNSSIVFQPYWLRPPLQKLSLPSHLPTEASWEDSRHLDVSKPSSIFSKTVFHTLLPHLLMKEILKQSPFNSRSSNGSNRVVQC